MKFNDEDHHESLQGGSVDITASRHIRAVIEAVSVTVLWSSSWVIIKFGLQEIPPLTFAGMRYLVASLLLIGVMSLRRETVKQTFSRTHKRLWFKVFIYGLVFITLTQGTQFVALSILDAITVSMFLNLTPVLVLLMGIKILGEMPTYKQSALILLCVIGVLLYFWPPMLRGEEGIGLVIVIIGVLANASASIMGREINRTCILPPIAVTAFGMLPGGLLLLGVAFLVEPAIVLSPIASLCILWLATVNTALAFTIWNRTLQTLRAVDSNVINSMMLPQIVVLSIIFLGERPDTVDYLALTLITICVLLLQLSQTKILQQLEQRTGH